MIYSLTYKLLDIVFQGLYFALIARIILSWIPHNAFHPFISIIYKITDPLLRPFQNILPSWNTGIDFSPILAFLALGFIRKIVFNLLFF